MGLYGAFIGGQGAVTFLHLGRQAQTLCIASVDQSNSSGKRPRDAARYCICVTVVRFKLSTPRFEMMLTRLPGYSNELVDTRVKASFRRPEKYW